MKNNDIEQLREDLNAANKKIDDLIEILVESQIMQVIPYARHIFYHSRVRVIRDEKELSDKIKMILNHLDLEFEWVDCNPHYELKEKKEDK